MAAGSRAIFSPAHLPRGEESTSEGFLTCARSEQLRPVLCSVGTPWLRCSSGTWAWSRLPPPPREPCSHGGCTFTRNLILPLFLHSLYVRMFVDRSRTLRVKTQPLLAGDTVHWVTQETPEALAPRPCHARRPQSPRASCEQEETVVLIELRGLQPESGVRGQERSHLDGRSLLKEKQDSVQCSAHPGREPGLPMK